LASLKFVLGPLPAKGENMIDPGARWEDSQSVVWTE